jgi:Tfp pilus assembly protein PilN
MIEINLLPGTAKRNRGRGSGFSIRAAASQATARIRDPYMLSAVASVVLAAAVVGWMHFTQSAKVTELEEHATVATRDSTRFAMVLRERHAAEAKRDSVVRQLKIIKSIDNDRFVWPHILDEVSRALPPYTWLKSIAQPGGSAATGTPPPPPGAIKDSTKRRDPEPSTEPLRFRIVGNTVDIQALTRFMKLLETSPFVQNVQLARSEMVMVEGKEITEFQLDAEYERPDKNLLSTAPVSLSVR